MATRRPDYRKRKREEQPAFLDATASVSASQFAGCRLPEIKELFATAAVLPMDANLANVQQPDALQTLQSAGRKQSSRHLRRRVKCFQSRKRHRYPRPGDAQRPAPTSTHRHVRRRHQLRHGHDEWRKEVPSSVAPTEGLNDTERVEAKTVSTTTATSKTIHWMSTHVWHAKRFRMASLFGWRIPILHQNRGCAAARRLCHSSKCLIRDATWCAQPLWIRGASFDAVASILGRLGMQLNNKDVGRTQISGGEGIAHEVDAAPLRAVCPVQWICSSSQPLFRDPVPSGGAATAAASAFFLYLFCHPSARSSLYACLSQAVQEDTSRNTIGPFDGIQGGLTCFQLRGSNDAVTNTYKATCARIFPNVVTQFLDSETPLQQQQQQHGEIVLVPGPPQTQPPAPFALRRVCPRDPTVPANYGVCGWDMLFCPGGAGGEFFAALVLAGGACPVGSTEMAFLALEAEPPCPVFPRDFPDTEQGRQYWSSSSDGRTDDHAAAGRNDAWAYLRRHWEGGEGRIRLPETIVPSLAQVDFSTVLESPTQDKDGSSVVVVRDSFARPLQQALNASGGIITSTAAARGRPKRRKRRSAGKQNCFVKEACPLSAEQQEVHQQFTMSLIDNLSLPAVLLVHIQLVGSGRMKPGGKVIFSSESSIAGYVTAGTFSAARGRYHGLGVVSARCLLKAVLCAGNQRTAMVAPTLLGSKQICLKVSVGDNKSNGVLTLL